MPSIQHAVFQVDIFTMDDVTQQHGEHILKAVFRFKSSNLSSGICRACPSSKPSITGYAVQFELKNEENVKAELRFLHPGKLVTGMKPLVARVVLGDFPRHGIIGREASYRVDIVYVQLGQGAIPAWAVVKRLPNETRDSTDCICPNAD